MSQSRSGNAIFDALMPPVWMVPGVILTLESKTLWAFPMKSAYEIPARSASTKPQRRQRGGSYGGVIDPPAKSWPRCLQIQALYILRSIQCPS